MLFKDYPSTSAKLRVLSYHPTYGSMLTDSYFIISKISTKTGICLLQKKCEQYIQKTAMHTHVRTDTQQKMKNKIQISAHKLNACYKNIKMCIKVWHFFAGVASIIAYRYSYSLKSVLCGEGAAQLDSVYY